MKIRLNLLLLCFLTLAFLINSYAQKDTSQHLKWVEGLLWEQIKQKAKQENKYIFVDAYTTWCAPCKKMDREVYNDVRLGEIVNEKFIAVKVQMDSSKNDVQAIRNWYADAYHIKKTCNIVAYPTFLFFSPDGILVHNDFGFKNVDEFIKLVDFATNPEKQYYILVGKYKQRKLTYSEMPSLAQKAKDLKDKDFADQVAHEYFTEFLYKQKDEVLFRKENLSFMKSFVQRSEDRGFQIYLKNSNRVDKIMGKDYSKNFIDYIVTKEDISPLLLKADSLKITEPQWTFISNNISKKYNKEIAYRTVLDARIRWYTYKKNWAKLADVYVDKFQKFGIDTVGFHKFIANNLIWNVFFIHNTDSIYLTKAISWMETILKSDPYTVSIIDTYANLLHKVGRTKEAVKFETIATRLAPDNKQLNDTLEKMKKGHPTHLESGAIWVLGSKQVKDKKKE